MTFEEL
jgi:hypothetical protein